MYHETNHHQHVQDFIQLCEYEYQEFRHWQLIWKKMWWEGHDPFWKQHVVRTLPPIARLSCKLWRQSHLPWHAACSHWWYKNMNRRTQVPAIVSISLWRAVSLVVVSEVIRTVEMLMRSFFRHDTTMGHVALIAQRYQRHGSLCTDSNDCKEYGPSSTLPACPVYRNLQFLGGDGCMPVAITIKPTFFLALVASPLCVSCQLSENHAEIWPVLSSFWNSSKMTYFLNLLSQEYIYIYIN